MTNAKPEKQAHVSYEMAAQNLAYDPESGIVTWLTQRGRSPVGSRAGTVNGSGYRQIRINGKIFGEHRLVFLLMTGRWPTELMDHINGDRSDNRWCNLREATHSQNGINKAKQSNNTSGITGISWLRRGQHWRARIEVNNKAVDLGFFRCFGKAVKARRNGIAKYHGEFAAESSRAAGDGA